MGCLVILLLVLLVRSSVAGCSAYLASIWEVACWAASLPPLLRGHFHPHLACHRWHATPQDLVPRLYRSQTIGKRWPSSRRSGAARRLEEGHLLPVVCAATRTLLLIVWVSELRLIIGTRRWRIARVLRLLTVWGGKLRRVIRIRVLRWTLIRLLVGIGLLIGSSRLLVGVGLLIRVRVGSGAGIELPLSCHTHSRNRLRAFVPTAQEGEGEC